MQRHGLCLLLLLVAPAQHAAFGEAAAPAVALVNGRPISTKALVDELMRQYGQETLSSLLHRRVLDQAMRRVGFRADPSDVKQIVQSERRAVEYAAPGVRSDKTFEQELRERLGMGVEQYAKSIVPMRLFVRHVVLQDVRPDRTELLLWYARHVNRYSRPAQVQVAHIFKNMTENGEGTIRSEAKIRAELADIRRRILAQEVEFEEAARRWSEDPATRKAGGVIGWWPTFLRGALPDAVRKLADGEVSAPFRGDVGYHLIRRVARRARFVPKFETIIPRVREDYRGERVRERADFLMEQLMERARITERLSEGMRRFWSALAAPGTGRTMPAVAFVNGEPVYAGEFLNTLIDRHGADSLAKLAHRAVIRQAMEREGVRIEPEEIRRALAEDRKAIEFRGTNIRSTFTLEAEVRRRFNMTLDEYARTVVPTRLFVRKLAMRNLDTSRAKLFAWYQTRQDRFTLPARIEVLHILLRHRNPKTNRFRSETWIRARMARIRRSAARGGNAFAKAARAYSEDERSRKQGGRAGWVPVGLKTNIGLVASRLRDGEVSGIVAGGDGYHLIKRLHRLPEEPLDFHEYEEYVRDEYERETVARRAERWAGDLLRAAKIERRLAEGWAAYRRQWPPRPPKGAAPAASERKADPESEFKTFEP